jgi:hypothetical protein
MVTFVLIHFSSTSQCINEASHIEHLLTLYFYTQRQQLSNMYCPVFSLIYASYFIRLARADPIQPSTRSPNQEHRQIQSVGTVVYLQLINADTNLPIANITNDTVVDVATFITSKFNIEAITSGEVRSIRFEYNGEGRFGTDSEFPFSMCPSSDTSRGPDFEACAVLAPGQHNVIAIPFSDTFETGEEGMPFQVTFNITNTCKTPQVRTGKL